MDAWLLAHEAQGRGWLFATLLLGIGLVESFAPARAAHGSTGRRWTHNLLLLVLGNLLARAVFPLMTVAWATWLDARGWGPLHRLPTWAAVAGSFLALDLAMYAQHMLLHRFHPLWRLHRVHHSDADYDCTTGLRFHPAEVVFTVGVRMAVVGVVGAAPLGVAAFELWLIFVTLFSHANFHLPPRFELVLRRVVVTPDLHRIHHSAIPHEYGTNFGNFFPWWDRCFGTYRERPRSEHADMIIGLPEFPPDRSPGFIELLLLPFFARPATVPEPVSAAKDIDPAPHRFQ